MSTSQPPTDPGLDPHKLAALRPGPTTDTALLDALAAHLEAHDSYLAFSGGKDSLAVLHLAHQLDPNIPVVFFDGGLEFPETYTYLADLTETWNLNLDVIRSTRSALSIMIDNGSWNHHSHPTSHTDLFTQLIEEPSRQAHTRHGHGRLWGVRADESAGRRIMFTTAINRGDTPGACTRTDGIVTYNPTWHFTTHQIWAYLTRHNVPVNPVYAKLRHLGAPETMCRVSQIIDAAHLEHGRLVWLRRGWPDLFETLTQVLPRTTEYA